jgi:endonuclease I
MLIYKQTPDLISNSGLSTGWNREHVWPKSYGVGYTGPDTSDLFALRAADWSVNSARNNRYYDDCLDPSACTIPAHDEAAADTGKMSVAGTTGIFMPPAAVRGDLARSLFYMSTRYDGTDPNTEDLTLSNCPCDTLNKMGMLSTLLEWHIADPVDAAEMQRNDLLCSDYQHNRNPYIDFPELVSFIFLEDDPTNCPVCPEKETEGDGDGAEFFAASSYRLQPGDVVITGYNR